MCIFVECLFKTSHVSILAFETCLSCWQSLFTDYFKTVYIICCVGSNWDYTEVVLQIKILTLPSYKETLLYVC
jgi:hypothetical protein